MIDLENVSLPEVKELLNVLDSIDAGIKSYNDAKKAKRAELAGALGISKKEIPKVLKIIDQFRKGEDPFQNDLLVSLETIVGEIDEQ